MEPSNLSLTISALTVPMAFMVLLMGKIGPMTIYFATWYGIIFYLLFSDRFGTNGFRLWGLGIANLITILRSLAMLLVFAVSSSIDPLIRSVTLTLLYLLDKLDGKVARRLKETSEIGETLDVESDAIITTMITFALVLDGIVPSLLVIVPFLRYFYVIILGTFRLPARKQRKNLLSAVVSSCFLLVLIWQWTLRSTVLYWLSFVFGMGIAFTFGRDFLQRVKKNGLKE